MPNSFIRKLRGALVLATICGFFLQVLPQTQDENILTRPSDENANTREDRQRAVTVLLAAARQNIETDPLKAARYFNRAGRLQQQLNTSPDALSTYQNGLSILKNKPVSNEKVDLLNGLAATYGYLSRCDEAQPFIKEAVTSSEENAYVAGRAEALLTLSDCQNFSDHALAVKTAQESLGLWQTLSNKSGIARAYASIGDFQTAQNDLLEAGENIEAALRIWRELNVRSEEAQALISLGFIEYRKGAWQNCLSFLTQAQSLIDEKAEPNKMAQIASGIAESFIESGMPETGLTKSQQAREYYRLAEDPRGVATLTWEIGKVRYLLGDHTNALVDLSEAMKAAERMKAVLLVAVCHDYLGRTYNAIEDQRTALDHFEIALTLYTQVGSPREAARTQALIGQLYQEQGQNGRARQYFQTALETFGKLSDRVNQSATLYALGRLELKVDNLELAENYLRQSIDATENLRRISTSRDLTAAFSASIHDRYAAYIECLMHKHHANPSGALNVAAFETSDLARARSLAELLRGTQTSPLAGLDPALAAQEKSLRQTLRVKEDYKVSLLAKDYKKEELDALEADLINLETQYDRLTDTIRQRYPAYEEITRPTPLTLKQIQQQVLDDDQTILLEYSLGIKKSFLWAVTRTELTSYELPDSATIEEAATHLYKSLSAQQQSSSAGVDQDQRRKAEEELPAQIAKLSKMLLTPVADKLNGRRLIVVADGILQYIPFQVLTAPANSSGGFIAARPLILDHDIINEPSGSTLALLLNESAHRQQGSKSVAILADPVFDVDDSRIKSPKTGSAQTAGATSPGGDVTRAVTEVGINGGQIPRLLSSRDEAASIVSLVPWLSAFKAIDFDANRGTAMGSNLGQYRVVHFATHALLNNEHPDLSGIVLSLVNQQGEPQDGYLRLQDIYNLKLPVDLVVLSACQTGLGKDVRGEGLIGLTRGFMYSGASGVVASLWKVDDEATAELMKNFYAGMFEKELSPSVALREAQLALRQQKRWQEPYYWAGFVIQGQYAGELNGNRMSPAVRMAALSAAVGILLCAVFFAIRRRRRRVS